MSEMQDQTQMLDTLKALFMEIKADQKAVLGVLSEVQQEITKLGARQEATSAEIHRAFQEIDAMRAASRERDEKLGSVSSSVNRIYAFGSGVTTVLAILVIVLQLYASSVAGGMRRDIDNNTTTVKMLVDRLARLEEREKIRMPRLEN